MELEITKELYRSRAHAKFFLCYHVVFATKYRKVLLKHGTTVQREVMHLFDAIATKYNDFEILAQGYDSDHVHLLIEATSPTVSPHTIVHRLKSQSTYHLWQNKEVAGILARTYKKRVFWSSGYFVTTTGEVDVDTVRAYIYSQGVKRKRRRRK